MFTLQQIVPGASAPFLSILGENMPFYIILCQHAKLYYLFNGRWALFFIKDVSIVNYFFLWTWKLKCKKIIFYNPVKHRPFLVMHMCKHVRGVASVQLSPYPAMYL